MCDSKQSNNTDRIAMKSKKHLPVGVLLFTLAIVLVSVPTFFVPWLTEVFAEVRPNGKLLHWWAFFTSTFEHGLYFNQVTQIHWFLLVHMFTNLTILWVFGTIMERHLGTDRFALISLAAFLTDTALGCIWDSFCPPNYSCGASGIVYAYIPVGLYLLWRDWKNRAAGASIWKKWQTYGLLVWMIYLYIFISVISGAFTISFHALSTLTGIGMLALFQAYDKKHTHASTAHWWSMALLIFPIVVIAVLYVLIFAGVITRQYVWI